MKVLKIGAYLFGVFIVFEILSRLLNPLGIGYYNRAYKYLSSCRDTGLGYYLNGKDANGYGLRCHEISNKEKKRILLIGDSIVYGLGVEQDKTFATLLDKALPDYEVINAGVGGWNTQNEFLWLGHEGIDLKPDLVILYITANDLENVYAGKIPSYPKWQKVIYNSYVLSSVFYIKRNVFRALFNRTSFKTNVTADANEVARAALNGIIDLSPKLVVCVYGSEECRKTDTLQFYLDILKENRIATFFLPENYYSGKYRISAVDHHPNEKGHEYIAKVTWEVIKSLEQI
jgi:hypothetical protein